MSLSEFCFKRAHHADNWTKYASINLSNI